MADIYVQTAVIGYLVQTLDAKPTDSSINEKSSIVPTWSR